MATNTGSTTGALKKEVQITSGYLKATASPDIDEIINNLREAPNQVAAQAEANKIPSFPLNAANREAEEWDRLPGRQGELNQESTSIDDTIFGEPYSSMFPGLITGTMTANAILKGIPGYNVVLRKAINPEGDAPTATFKLVRITDTTANPAPTEFVYRFIPDNQHEASFMAFDVDHVITPSQLAPTSGADTIDNDSKIVSVDYLFTEITLNFDAGDAINYTGPVLTFQRIGRGQTYTLTQSLNPIDETDFDTAQENDGRRRFVAGLKRVSLEVGGFFRPENNFLNELQERDKVLISISPDGQGDAVARIYAHLMRDGQRGDVGALEEESIMYELNVLEEIDNPMDWRFNFSGKNGNYDPRESIVSRSNQRLLNAWLCGTHLGARYLPNGRDSNGANGIIEYGYTTAAIVSDATLSSGLDNVPEFRASLQLDGHLARRDQARLKFELLDASGNVTTTAADVRSIRGTLIDRNGQPLAAAPGGVTVEITGTSTITGLAISGEFAIDEGTSTKSEDITLTAGTVIGTLPATRYTVKAGSTFLSTTITTT